MVGVQPRLFRLAQQRDVDQPPVDRGERQRLEGQKRLVAAGNRLGRPHQLQVLDADAVVAGAVVAGLVGDDHAGAERYGAGLGDALRAFVHRQKAADAVARAMVEVEAGLPQRVAGERVDLRAARAFGKPRRGDGDVALEHQREMAAHLGCRRPDRHRAGDVGGAVDILRAGIDQIERIRLQRPVGVGGDAIVDDGAVGAGPRDGVEGDFLELARRRAEAFQRRGRGDLVDAAGCRLAVEPGEEAADGGAVAQVGGARAGDLGRVLGRLGQGAGIVAVDCAPARGLDPVGDPARRGRRVEANGALSARRLVERRSEFRRLGDVGDVLDMGARGVGELARIDQQRWPPLGRNDGEGQRQRRVLHVGAADVEEPGDRIRLGQHGRAGPRLRQRLLDIGELVGGGTAGDVERVHDDLAKRRARPVGPDGVDRIVRCRHQRGAGLLGDLLEPADTGDGMQPGVVTERRAGLQLLLQPGVPARIDQVQRLEGAGVDLVADLQGVAAVDEDRRGVLQHHGQAGGAGEAGEPFQPLGAGRHVLALMLVGTGDQKAVEAAPLELGPESGQTLCTVAWIGTIVEGLEHRS